MFRFAATTLLIAATGLAGCGTFRPDPAEQEARRAERAERARETGNVPIDFFQSREGDCAPVTILADAEEVTKFDGGGYDVTNILYVAQLEDVETSCTYGRELTRRYGYSSVDLNMTAVLGGAAQPQSMRIPYFVAVVNPATQEVLTRETYEVRADFTPGNRTLELQDEVGQVRIPVVENEDALLYEIVIGFELTPAEVEHNRRGRDLGR